MNQIIHKSVLQVVGQAQYVEGVLQGVLGIGLLCIGHKEQSRLF